tara:strand:- start:1881 stop:2111 length:231 start_codon:yes stop_codon:yes gene_type:complete
MKFLFLILTVLFLSACTPSHKNKTQSFSLPPELADCKVFMLSNDIGSSIYVTRCPNSTTNTSTTGKNAQSVTVIEN